MTKLTEKVDFNLIRYANCWEDADVLLQGLNAKSGSRILSIGSAGDNSFSLLTTDPELIVAVDVNPTQLYLIELKKVCFQQLEREAMIAFLGFQKCKNRLKTFNLLKSHLSESARIYWEANRRQIKKGIVAQGKFENYFRLFSKRVLPWIHSKKIVETLLSAKSAFSQQRLYRRIWNSWRWKSLFRIFFSRFIMGKFGRDPEFLKEVEVSVGAHIFEKAEKHLETVGAQNNFMLRYQLTGSFGNLLPHYLQAENFQKIKSNIHKLRIIQGYAEDAIQEFGKFNYMNLSNIFEYMDKTLFIKTAKQLIGAVEKGGALVYWNLMVPRRMSAFFPDKLSYQQYSSEELTKKDKGFFYNQFIIEQVR